MKISIVQANTPPGAEDKPEHLDFLRALAKRPSFRTWKLTSKGSDRSKLVTKGYSIFLSSESDVALVAVLEYPKIDGKGHVIVGDDEVEIDLLQQKEALDDVEQLYKDNKKRVAKDAKNWISLLEKLLDRLRKLTK